MKKGITSLPWKSLSASNLTELVQIIQETEGSDLATLSLYDILVRYIYTSHKLKLIPLMYENRSINQYDVYLYFAYNFGWTPDVVDKLPADMVSYFLAKKISRL